MAQLAADQGPLRAYEQVMGFAARRGEAALRLAMHAALPQVLRAELLHLIRLNFLPEAAHDLAIEADVLFAPFCEDIGNGYYCFAGSSRRHLLQGLDPAYREELSPRSVQVARFMLDYLEHEERDVRTGSDRLRSDWIEVERWSALAFAAPALAAGQLAAALARATANDDIAARVRVGGLASALATPLARFGELLAYTEGVEALQLGCADDAGRLFDSLPDVDIEIAGIRLKSPRRVLADSAGRGARPERVAGTPETQGDQAEAEEAPIEHVAPVGDQIYISYSHRDQEWYDLLTTHLKPILGPPELSAWDEFRILASDPGEKELDILPESARLAVILVSADYLTSDYLMERDLPRLVELARSGEVTLTWVCVRPCDWTASALASIQALSDPGKALSEMSPLDRDKALVQIAGTAGKFLRSEVDARPEAARAEYEPFSRGGIFLVYRREDAATYAMRLRDFLRARFGDRIFMDVADIPPGKEFRESIGGAIRRAAAMIVLIGPGWLGPREPDGLRRIDEPNDLVRMEVVKALEIGIPVVPVLVDGATLPRANELPDDLARFAQLNAAVLTDVGWEDDLGRLARDLARLSPELLGVKPDVQVEKRGGLRSLRIYLSSTMTDLGEDRVTIVRGLRQLGHYVVGPESYVATTQRPLDEAYADIAACDVLVCIVAWRYGFVPEDSDRNPERRSIVELEYRHAIALGKPTLVFMLAEDAPWDPKAMDAMTGEGEKGERIDGFRRELASQAVARFFRSADELSQLVRIAVSALAWSSAERTPMSRASQETN